MQRLASWKSASNCNTFTILTVPDPDWAIKKALDFPFP
jgi:hypothetical protein